jgi:hypothetical protein
VLYNLPKGQCSVADLHHFDANPDPACHIDPDPYSDPACPFHADPDPPFHMRIRIHNTGPVFLSEKSHGTAFYPPLDPDTVVPSNVASNGLTNQCTCIRDQIKRTPINELSIFKKNLYL